MLNPICLNRAKASPGQPRGTPLSNMDDLPRYYRTRESQEREAAELSQSEDVRRIHLVLASKYRQLADDEEGRAQAD
jgi:hypothetical protein